MSVDQAQMSKPECMLPYVELADADKTLRPTNAFFSADGDLVFRMTLL